MAEIADLSDSLIRRQSVSETNHVNRIRSAHSKRMSVLLTSTEMVNYLGTSVTNQDEGSVEKGMSMSDFSNRRKSHHDCVESLEEHRIGKEHISNDAERYRKLSITPNSGTIRRLTVAGTHPVMGTEKKSFSSPNTKGARRRTTILQTTTTTANAESNKSQRTNTLMKNKTNTDPQKRRKTSTGQKSAIINNKAGTNQTAASNRKQSISIENEQSKKNVSRSKLSSPINHKSEFDKLVEICDSKGNIAKDLAAARDVIVLKWLHELNCPLSEKEESASDLSEMKRSPIRILKKIPEAKEDKSKEKLSYKMKSPNIIKKLELPILQKKESPEENRKLDDSHYEKTKHETDSTEEIPKYIPAVEMHVSELGKLQIILDSKDLSSEDAAIVIWIDDIPKSFFTPEYSRRLSLAPEPDLLTLGIPIETIKSQSSSELEDVPSPKPDIYFPPVTILKNTAIDSRHGLRKLSDYGDNSALYKRCNIDHVEWGFYVK